MRAVLCKSYGPPDTLVVEEVPAPSLGAGDVRLRVHACGVNFPDTLIIQDKYQFKPPRPFAPGHEIAGDITEVGEGVGEYKVGDRVIGMIGHGGYATEAVVDVGQLLPMPKNMSYEDGAAFTMTYGTSYYALKQRSSYKPGETLLVTGASGGVGLTAVELGALMGLMPGMGQIKKAMNGANLDEKVFDRQVAIINSMTKAERANPDLLNAKRRIRIAGGSGTKVEDVNKLMKQHRQMADMMKKVSKGGLGSLAGMFGGKMGNMMPGLGNMPDPSTMDPRELERMAREMGIDPASIPPSPAAPKDISQKLPTDVGQLLKSGSGVPGLGGNRFPGLPGLGGGFVPKKK